jgi:predicted nucleic-acid-binding protein
VISVDTNVLARYLLDDEPAQFAQALALLSGGVPCSAPLTVFLELVWVLEGKNLAREDIARGLRMLLGLPNFRAFEPQTLAQALAWYEQGLDFADALHLAQSGDAEHFASFDRRLANRAQALGATPAVCGPAQAALAGGAP